jgi:hypothetical protein
MAAALGDWRSESTSSARAANHAGEIRPLIDSERRVQFSRKASYKPERWSPTRHAGLAEWGGRITTVATRHLEDVLTAWYQTFVQDLAHLARQSGRQVRFGEE